VVACNPIRYPFQVVATLPNTTDRLTDLERAAWGGYLRSHAAIVRQLDATLVEAHGLPLSSFEVLARLAQQDEGKQRMSDLAQSVWLSRSGVTRLVDRLERDGLVERQACDSDARGAFAVITEAGRARLETARRTHVSDVRERFLSRFDGDEQAQLAAFWDRLDS
jgi:DNA-binding MarR family transcriptional regulator